MNHALVTFLGKGRENPTTGYREATCRFPDGIERCTPFLGLAQWIRACSSGSRRS
ncbi:MAG: hypothetical protein AB1768_13400 [Pseudomonadota bacterium]|jgi:hypothetical protein